MPLLNAAQNSPRSTPVATQITSWRFSMPPSPAAPRGTLFPGAKLPIDVSIAKQRVVTRLIEKASGRNRVIVGVSVPFGPEGTMAAAAAASQRVSIRRAKQSLFAQMPIGAMSVTREFESIPYFTAEIDAAGLKRLGALDNVTSIQEDGALRPNLPDSTPLIGATTAWQYGVTGSGWTVAILDSGVDKSHPFLAGKVISEACYSTNSSSITSFCPGGVSSSTAAGSALPCPSAVSNCEHGTHVAGIAAGRGPTFSGVAKDASIIAIQTASNYSTDCGSYTAPCAQFVWGDLLSALQRIYDLRTTFSIASVNLSVGVGAYTSQTECDAENQAAKAIIDNLRSAGIATVISAGNANGFLGIFGSSNALSAPACISSAVSVSSTTKSDEISFFSNRASFLSMMAPGQSILSSVPGGGYAVLDGTSMAAPHVAAAFALLRSLKPSASVGDIVEALRETGRGITDSATGAVYPRIQIVEAALALLNPTGLSVPDPPSNLTSSSNGSYVTLTWSPPSSGTTVTAYSIEAGSSSGLSNLANFSTGNTATAYSASGIAGGTYYIRVRASDGVGASAPSNETVLRVSGCTNPGAPTGLSVVLSSGGTIALSWTAGSGNPTSYIVEAGSSSGLTNVANSDLGSPATSLTATGVAIGTYYVRMRSKNSCGISGTSNEVVVVMAGTTTSPLTGTWGNLDPLVYVQGGITQVSIRSTGGSIFVNLWVACGFVSECPDGEVPATAGSVGSLTAVWNLSGAVQTATLSLTANGYLNVGAHVHFTDGSGRADYDVTAVLVKTSS